MKRLESVEYRVAQKERCLTLASSYVNVETASSPSIAYTEYCNVPYGVDDIVRSVS